MKNNYVLIDFENVQPVNVDLLKGRNFKLIVFVGASQKNIPCDFAMALQDLGENASYVKISGNGSNALDFHIACYLGEMAAKDASGRFHVISRDKGYDPLIAHMRERSICVRRHEELAEIPCLRVSNSRTLDEKIDAIVASLISRGTARPRKVKTLANTVNALFQKTLNDAEQTNLIKELQKRRHIVVKDQSVSYGPLVGG
ncbi:MAG: PIN domain-containing protein [Nitratireductor sp.]